LKPEFGWQAVRFPLTLINLNRLLATQSKNGVSNIELARRLGDTQSTGMTVNHKLSQVMLERNSDQRLSGSVQMDDAYIGGERSGKRGGGTEAKTPFLPPSQQPDAGMFKFKLAVA